MPVEAKIILGIDPGLAHTGWGIVSQTGSKLTCLAYGCITTDAKTPLEKRLVKIYQQISAVIQKFQPVCLGIESVWFGDNVSSAFGTGQARGAVLVACGEAGLVVGEYTPNQIKAAVAGVGHAEKDQVQYMVKQVLGLSEIPQPDHAGDALAAAICFTTLGVCSDTGAVQGSKFEAAVARAIEKEEEQRNMR